MAADNKPQDDVKAMTTEYIQGATIAHLSAHYNRSEQEVADIVTKPVIIQPSITQQDQDKQESKKEK